MKVKIAEVVVTEREVELPTACPKCAEVLIEAEEEGGGVIDGAITCMVNEAHDREVNEYGEPGVMTSGDQSFDGAIPTGYYCGNCGTNLI